MACLIGIPDHSMPKAPITHSVAGGTPRRGQVDYRVPVTVSIYLMHVKEVARGLALAPAALHVCKRVSRPGSVHTHSRFRQ